MARTITVPDSGLVMILRPPSSPIIIFSDVSRSVQKSASVRVVTCAPEKLPLPCWSFAGVPALSVPCGFDGNGMPLAMQIAAPWFDETTALRLGHAYQGATGHHLRAPVPVGV